MSLRITGCEWHGPAASTFNVSRVGTILISASYCFRSLVHLATSDALWVRQVQPNTQKGLTTTNNWAGCRRNSCRWPPNCQISPHCCCRQSHDGVWHVSTQYGNMLKKYVSCIDLHCGGASRVQYLNNESSLRDIDGFQSAYAANIEGLWS